MTITVGDVSTAEGDTNQLDIASHTVAGSDKILLVCVVLETTAADKDVLSVAWDPVGVNETLTLWNAHSPGHGKLRLEVWSLTDPSDVTNALVRVTLDGGNAQKFGAAAVTVNGVHQTTPLEDWTSASGTTANPSITVPNTATDDLVMDCGSKLVTDAATPGADQFERYDLSVQSLFRLFGSTQDGADGGVMSWTVPGGSKEYVLGGFNVRASAGGTTKTVTASLQAAIEKQSSLAASLQGAVQKGFSRTAQADAGVAAGRSEDTALDSALAQRRAATASAEAALQKDQLASALTDAALRVEVQRQAGLAAALALARAGVTNLEAALRKTETPSAGLEAALEAAQSATAALDAAFAREIGVATAVQAALRALVTVATGLDASIAAISLRTVTASLAAAVRATLVAGAALDAALHVARETSAQADAALAGTALLGAGLDANIDLPFAPAGTRTFGHGEDRDRVITAGGRTFVVPAGNRKH